MMNRTLQIVNTIGVIALAVLCVLQWRANRAHNLEINRLEKIRIEHSSQVEELSAKVKGYTEDLESFRSQITRTAKASQETADKLNAAERESARLAAENEQLKSSVTNWANAVNVRDERIKEANGRLQKLADQLNASIVSYNKLATNYNTVVSQLDAIRAAAKQTESATPKTN